MYHTLAWFESLNAQTDEDMAPVVDGVFNITNNHFLPQNDIEVLWAAAFSANINRARFANPSFNQVVLPQIRPVMQSLLPATDPNVADYRDNPLRMKGLEELIVQATMTVAVAENVAVVAGVRSAAWPEMAVPRGDIFTLRGTNATAVTANAWTEVTTTWDVALPYGEYVIVGAEYFSTTAKAFRLRIENQIPRPGGLGFAGVGSRSHYMFYKGGLGVWGKFRSTAMPNVQVFANAADAAGTVFLDLIRVG